MIFFFFNLNLSRSQLIVYNVFLNVLKGGFAKCYEIMDTNTKQVFAGKIVSKRLLAKNNQKEKMSQEIEIHKSLSHKHVVQFHRFFEDADFVYVILELCRKRSMMELHK